MSWNAWVFSLFAFVSASTAECVGAQESTFSDLGLTIRLPELEDLEQTLGTVEDQVRCTWTGTLYGSSLRMDLIVLEATDWGFREAGEVSEVVVDYLRRTRDFDVDRSWYLEGDFGYAPVLAVVSGEDVGADDEVGEQFVAGGLTRDYGYALHASVRPPLNETDRKAFMEFFEEGIAHEGPRRDPNWTMEEIEARWIADTPEELHADFLRNLSKKSWIKKSVVRTKNYVILTNASGGKLFAKKMEENYKEIVKVFAFIPVKGRRLMPVFLFRTPEEYYAFYRKRIGGSLEAAQRSKGHAWKDYYATWYEAPNDPVHIHEQTHQIFDNRLLLSGGGSWFQEGVAEYIESTENDRNVVANLVKKSRHMPLEQFFELKSLLWSSEKDRAAGGSEAADLYKQAALFIEFLRESKWGKGKFDEFLYTLGYISRGNLEQISAGFDKVYGVSIQELEAEFEAYCAKR